MTNEVKVPEEAVRTGLSRGGKVAIVVGASVLTLGTVYGCIRLVRHIKARRAAKSSEDNGSK